MQFNSFLFLFGFLPAVLIGFYVVSRHCSPSWPKAGLIAASLLFCGWYTHWFCVVLVVSTVLTWCAAALMVRFPHPWIRAAACLLGITASFGNLLFWKYSAPLLEVLNLSALTVMPPWSLVLPLGISFYTFQQLVYVLDVFGHKAPAVSLMDYVLFVTFFPQLVIGPIVRHDELIPQLTSPAFGSFRLQNLIVGGAILVTGLAKKVILADNLAIMVNPVYETVQRGTAVSVIAACTAAVAYSLQLYADFSGYSDMSVGLARMFGLRLPANFHSPFKAASISEFWRRWHITLTRVLTPLVYTPISLRCTRLAMRSGWSGVSAKLMMTGPATLAVFVLIGLWHGATLTFLIVGVMHAVYVMIEYLWRTMSHRRLPRRISVGFTFLLVTLSLVCFRSPDVGSFLTMLESFSGRTGLGTWSDIDHSIVNIGLLAAALVICFCCPNTQQLFARYRPVIYTYAEHRRESAGWRIRLGPRMAFGLGFLFVLSCAYLLEGRAVFLYQGF